MNTYMRHALALLAAAVLLPGAHASYFPDVPEDHPFEADINFLYELDIVTGNPDGTFAPERLLNRAEFAKLVVEAWGSDVSPTRQPCFRDVPAQAWFSPYVCKAKQLGLMTGDGSGGTFSPERPLNTAEILAVMDRLFAWRSPAPQPGEAWYAPYLYTAVQRHIYDTAINPAEQVQRQRFAEVMARSLAIYDMNVDAFTSNALYDEYLSYDTANQIAAQTEDPNYSFSDDEDGTLLEDYTVSGDTITPVADSRHTIATLAAVDTEENHEMIWRLFTSLVPAEQRKDLDGFQITTDGYDGTMAYVHLSDAHEGKWVLAVDIMDSFNPDGTLNRDELAQTLIHEFAHVLTLREGQLFFSEDSTTCATYFTGEGCALPNGYLGQFYSHFWASIMADHPVSQAFASDSAREDAVYAYYDSHQQDFVTDYAATDPAEDIAETFMVFVVKSKPSSAGTVADQKILFFWDYPELVSLRALIRNKLR